MKINVKAALPKKREGCYIMVRVLMDKQISGLYIKRCTQPIITAFWRNTARAIVL